MAWKKKDSPAESCDCTCINIALNWSVFLAITRLHTGLDQSGSGNECPKGWFALRMPNQGQEEDKEIPWAPVGLQGLRCEVSF